MVTSRCILIALTIATTFGTGRQDVESPEGTAARSPRARCIWATEGIQDTVEHISCPERPLLGIIATRQHLRRHALEHGWLPEGGGPASIPAAGLVPCDGEALDELVQVVREARRTAAHHVVRATADVLDGNGRHDEAIQILKEHRLSCRGASRALAECAVALARRTESREDWESVLEILGPWEWKFGCGLDWQGQSRKRSCEVRALLELERGPRLRSRCIDAFRRGSLGTDAICAYAFFESYYRSGTIDTLVEVLEELASELQARTVQELWREWRHWRIERRLPDAEPEEYAALADCDMRHDGAFFAAVTDSSFAVMPRLVRHLHDHEEEWYSREQALLEQLARTGHPLLGPLVERHPLADHLVSDWEVARTLWRGPEDR